MNEKPTGTVMGDYVRTNVDSIKDTYSEEAFALFMANPRWDLAELHRQCEIRKIRCYR